MKRKAIAGAAIGIIAATLGMASSASASSGRITSAYANAEWTKGDLAGEANWTDCGSDPCEWEIFATVQPSLPEYSCRPEEWLEYDRNVMQVWSGHWQATNGTASFDLPEASILPGVYGQRLCLMGIEIIKKRNEWCEKTEELWGNNPENCPIESNVFGRVLAWQLLTVAPPPTPIPPSTAPPSSPPSGSAGRLRCKKGFRKRLVNGKARCVKIKKHKHRRPHRRQSRMNQRAGGRA